MTPADWSTTGIGATSDTAEHRELDLAETLCGDCRQKLGNPTTLEEVFDLGNAHKSTCQGVPL